MIVPLRCRERYKKIKIPAFIAHTWDIETEICSYEVWTAIIIITAVKKWQTIQWKYRFDVFKTIWYFPHTGFVHALVFSCCTFVCIFWDPQKCDASVCLPSDSINIQTTSSWTRLLKILQSAEMDVFATLRENVHLRWHFLSNHCSDTKKLTDMFVHAVAQVSMLAEFKEAQMQREKQ